jgi:hypothetical protein
VHEHVVRRLRVHMRTTARVRRKPQHGTTTTGKSPRGGTSPCGEAVEVAPECVFEGR